MNQITKKPPNKKRHTKPCRFYQTMKCPYSAEDCDFAHVLTSEPTYQSTKPCRYYVAGHCSNGVWCRYRHNVERHIEDYDLPHPESSDDGSFGPSLNQKHPQRGDEQFSTDAQLLPPVYIPPTQIPPQGIHLPSPAWPPYSDTFPSPQFPTDFHVQQGFQPNLASPTNSSESITSLATSSPSSVSDDIVIVADDIHTAEQSLCYQSQFPEEMTQCLSTPRFYHSPNTPVTVMSASSAYPVLSPAYGLHAPKPPGSPAPSHSRSQPRSASSRQKTANYKTKPCKFYKPGSSCPNGDKCTFIHDDPLIKPAGTVANEESPEHQSRNLQHGLPPKPVSLREENTKKGYFPVPWRIIGGGVLMSGHRSRSLSEDNCTPKTVLLYPNESVVEQADQIASETSDIGQPSASEDLSQGNNRKSRVSTLSICVPEPFDTVAFPSTAEDDVTPTLRVTPRVRATSIPPTPSTNHVDILTLFSAESPGGL